MQKTQYFFKFLEAVNEEGTVYYKIQVHLPGQEQEPVVFRSRYSQLRDIHDRCLKILNKNDLPDFPEKKLFGTTKEDFIQKRKKQLEHYYNTIGQTMDIQKIPDLYKYIESHKKKNQMKKNKESGQQGKIEGKPKKEDQLKSVFQQIYQDVIGRLTNMTDDFYPEDEINMHKKYASQLSKIKPIQSDLLRAPKVKGREQNDGEFWSIFFVDDNEDLLKQSDDILHMVNTMQEEVLGARNYPVAIAQ